MRATLFLVQRAAATALASLCMGAATAEQPSRATAETHATWNPARWAQGDAILDQIYGRNLSPEKRAVAKAHLGAVLSDERWHAYVAQLLKAVASPTLTEREAGAIVIEGIASLKARGLLRLSTEQQARVVQLAGRMSAAVPVETCKAMALGKLDSRAVNLIEARYTASLPLREFEAVLALARDAIEAELDEHPDVRTVNKTQAKAAERAHAVALEARAKRLPAGLLDRGFQDGEAADPHEVCLAMRESVAAGLDLKEPYRTWWLSQFFANMPGQTGPRSPDVEMATPQDKLSDQLLRGGVKGVMLGATKAEVEMHVRQVFPGTAMECASLTGLPNVSWCTVKPRERAMHFLVSTPVRSFNILLDGDKVASIDFDFADDPQRSIYAALEKHYRSLGGVSEFLCVRRMCELAVA